MDYSPPEMVANMPQLSIAEALRQAIREEMRRDPTVFCIGEDIGIPGGFGGAFTVTLGLSEEFGHERILDTPISELGLTGIAVGAAMAGLRPIADMQYADFLFLAMDQLANQAAKMTYMSGGTVKVPLVMRAPVGATARGSQHAQSLEAFFCHVPGLKVLAPATAYDAKGLLKAAVRDDNPVIIFEHKLLYGSKGPRSERGAVSPMGEVPDEDYVVPIGQGIVRREGRDVTIVGKLLTLYRALEAAETLAQEGIEAEVIDPRTLVPMDKELILGSVRKTGRLVIVEEDNLTGGWAGELAALAADEAFWWLDAPVKRVSAPDVPPPFAPIMEQFYVPSAQRVIEAVRSLF
jgi:pyruvate dehydrogenase E1 component beta subunit